MSQNTGGYITKINDLLARQRARNRLDALAQSRESKADRQPRSMGTRPGLGTPSLEVTISLSHSFRTKFSSVKWHIRANDKTVEVLSHQISLSIGRFSELRQKLRILLKHLTTLTPDNYNQIIDNSRGNPNIQRAENHGVTAQEIITVCKVGILTWLWMNEYTPTNSVTHNHQLGLDTWTFRAQSALYEMRSVRIQAWSNEKVKAKKNAMLLFRTDKLKPGTLNRLNFSKIIDYVVGPRPQLGQMSPRIPLNRELTPVPSELYSLGWACIESFSLVFIIGFKLFQGIQKGPDRATTEITDWILLIGLFLMILAFFHKCFPNCSRLTEDENRIAIQEGNGNLRQPLLPVSQ